MTTKGPAVQLEGWLPGTENNGLPAAGEALIEAFEDAYGKGDDTGPATATLVVGLIEVVGVKHRKNPEEKPPVVATRFMRIEVVKPGDAYQKVRDVLDEIHDARNGNSTLPGMGDDQGDDGPGEGPEILAAAREKRARGGK
jgi:hypothetical protein